MKPSLSLNLWTFFFCLAVSQCANAADADVKGSHGAAAPNLSPGQKELAHDDGISAGKRSVAGSGHAVRFEAPGNDYYLTAVRVFGSRYGQPAPPPDQAYVWLCDSDFKLLSVFPFAYATFQRGDAQWVTLPVKPTHVPQRFIICVGFNQTATKGVYVHHDSASSGDSLLGLPGRDNRAFDKGDWLIRAVVQQAADK